MGCEDLSRNLQCLKSFSI